jgi:hypothetical protein
MTLGVTAGLFLICQAPTARAAGKTQPDLVVSSIGFTSPASPVAGQSVTFSCVVKNVGKGNIASGAVIGVGYLIDGVQVSWGTVYGPLRAGQSITVGTNGGAWAATEGSHTFTAVVDDVQRIAESSEANNTLASAARRPARQGPVRDQPDPSPAHPRRGPQPGCGGCMSGKRRGHRSTTHVADYRARGASFSSSTTLHGPSKPACLAPTRTDDQHVHERVSDLAAHHGTG